MNAVTPPVELSLVLPCYNEQNHLEQVLRDWMHGLRSLTPHYEIIVVNDGSRDRSGRLLDQLRKQFPRLRVLHQLNGGMERALRRGLELARGEYVIQGECSGRFRIEDYRHLWEQRDMGELVLGYRPNRDTQWRWGESLIRSTARLFFRCQLEEPALSLRLYRGASLALILPHLPRGKESLNLLMTLRYLHRFPRGVQQVSIPYRPRFGGKVRQSLTHAVGLTLLRLAEMGDLLVRRAIRHLRPARPRLSQN